MMSLNRNGQNMLTTTRTLPDETVVDDTSHHVQFMWRLIRPMMQIKTAVRLNRIHGSPDGISPVRINSRL